MNSEVLRLLIQFDNEQVVQQALKLSHGQYRHFNAANWICDAMDAGLLEERDGEGRVIRSDKCYSRLLILTAKGREACGLPPISVKPVKKKARKQEELF